MTLVYASAREYRIIVFVYIIFAVNLSREVHCAFSLICKETLLGQDVCKFY